MKKPGVFAMLAAVLALVVWSQVAFAQSDSAREVKNKQLVLKQTQLSDSYVEGTFISRVRDQASSRIGLRRTPRPSISTSHTSPGFM